MTSLADVVAATIFTPTYSPVEVDDVDDSDHDAARRDTWYYD